MGSENVDEPDEPRRGRTRARTVAGIVLLSAVVIAVVCLIVWAATKESSTTSTSSNVLERIDCFPEAKGGVEQLTSDACTERGCIFEPDEEYPMAPDCYVPQDDSFGYTVVSGPEETELGFRWYLEPITSNGIYGENYKQLLFEVEELSDDMLRFKFEPADEERFHVPLDLDLPDGDVENPRYRVVVDSHPFSFQVVRVSTGTVLWDTSVGGLAFTDQFIQIATRLPSSYMYGMGENLHSSFRHDLNFRSWPMFSRDQPPWGADEHMSYNLYSVHPFYECLEDDETAHGVFFLNSNAMDYTLTPAPMLVYKTVGGILDFYMFLGPSAENVVQQYTQIVGRPMMPPYWSLGFQLSRFGFKNLDHMQTAVNRTLEHNIPLDVVYGDIDTMDGQRDFTIDPVNFPDLPQYFTNLKLQGIHTVVILDPCIEINDTYPPYVRGRDLDIYVKWPSLDVMPPGDYEEYGRMDMMGYVWPEWKVVFPDFFKSETIEWWEREIKEFIQELPFDGLWIDMNEPANFDTNKDKIWNWPDDRLPYWSLNCTHSKWDDPPYRTMASIQYDEPEDQLLERLSGKTICMQGVHADGKLNHYDVHSLYGWQQVAHTQRILREALGDNKRGLIVSRSTYSGSGKHTGRWLGDNASTWKDMHLSIIGLLEFNLLGIPYIGADICGYFDNCTASLCKRWQELGAFYTFSRNHNNDEPHDQDPGFFGENVASPARRSLEIRYTLLPYLYTLFHNAHTKGDTVLRPLMHEFQTDRVTWDIDRQFLWGPAFLIAPILEEDVVTLDYYLPESTWYDYRTLTLVTSNGGYWLQIEVTDDTPIPLFIRGGYILPTQRHASNTVLSRRNPFGLKIALDDNEAATGELFWDDGDTLDTYQNEAYYLAHYQCENGELTSTLTFYNNVPEIETLIMDDIDITGLKELVDLVLVNGEEHQDFQYDESTKVLRLYNLNLAMNTEFTVTWSERDVRRTR